MYRNILWALRMTIESSDMIDGTCRRHARVTSCHQFLISIKLTFTILTFVTSQFNMLPADHCRHTYTTSVDTVTCAILINSVILWQRGVHCKAMLSWILQKQWMYYLGCNVSGYTDDELFSMIVIIIKTQIQLKVLINCKIKILHYG